MASVTADVSQWEAARPECLLTSSSDRLFYIYKIGRVAIPLCVLLCARVVGFVAQRAAQRGVEQSGEIGNDSRWFRRYILALQTRNPYELPERVQQIETILFERLLVSRVGFKPWRCA